jgi:hypothetical protein
MQQIVYVCQIWVDTVSLLYEAAGGGAAITSNKEIVVGTVRLDMI